MITQSVKKYEISKVVVADTFKDYLGVSQSLCKSSNWWKMQLPVWSFFMVRRKNDSLQKAAIREMMRGVLKDNDISIKNGTDVNAIMHDRVSAIMGGTLNEELDEELGYSK